MTKKPLTPRRSAALNKIRWDRLTPEERADALAPARAARAPGQQSRAAKAISPEAARARAIKAAETRRRRLALEAGGEVAR
jgi:hypothetical protein